MAKDDTFELIRSLTQNEKRSFRLFAKLTEGDKNYMRVFKALEGMTAYDEKKLLKKLIGKKINLSHEKKYLQKQILRSLRLYREESTAELQTRSLNMDTEILSNKWQRSLAEKTARKSLTIAEQSGRLLQMSVALNHLDWLFSDKEVSDEMYVEWNGVLLKNRSVQQSMLNVTDIRLMNNELTYFSKRYGSSISSDEKERIQKMLQHPLLLTKNKFNMFHENIERINLKTRIYYRLGSLKEEADCHLQAIAVFEKANDDGTQFNFRNLITTIGNYIACKIELKQFTGLEKYFEKMNSLKFNSPQNTIAWLESVSLRNKMKFFAATGNFSEGIRVFTSAKNDLKTMHPEHLYQMNYYYSLLLFMANDFKASSKRLSTILEEGQELRLDNFVNASLILQLLNYFELKDFDLLHHRAVSVKRSLESKKQLFGFERELLNFFIKAEVDTRKAEFQKLHSSLGKITKSKNEISINKELDVIGWIERKLN